MELNLIVVNGQHFGSGAESVLVDVDVFSIGRGTDNSWVLPDPDLHISSKHCVIHRKNNEFHLTDISTNGVFLNGADEPVGRGSSIVLKQGDLFTVGGFEIKAELSDVGAPESVGESFDELLSMDSPIGETPDFAKIIAPVPDLGSHGAHLDSSQSNRIAQKVVPPEKETFRVPSASEVSPAFSGPPDERVDTPVSGAIPENWLDQLEGTTVPPVTASGGSTAVTGMADEPDFQTQHDTEAFVQQDLDRTPVVETVSSSEAVTRTPQVERSEARAANTNACNNSKSDFELFLESAGVSAELNRSDKDTSEVAQELGELLRILLQGIVEALATRSLVKGEFRLQQTMIRPSENNPLKFSPTGVEALKIMLMSGSSAYMSSSAAATEGFRDVQAHQLAMMSGIQSAFEKLLSRFDPGQLEDGFARRPRYKSRNIMGREQIDYWKEYKDFYEEICSLMKDDFQSLFANEFGKAYEDRLRQLK